jgi:hypothetical protein
MVSPQKDLSHFSCEACSLVPAFGSGAAYAVVTGIGADQPGGMFASALSSGAGFAVFQGALVQVWRLSTGMFPFDVW